MTTQSSDPARNGHNPTLDAALAMMLRGWSVFPAHLDESGAKVPIGELVEHGFKEATLNPRRAKLWWRVRPDALIGAAMPRDTVAVDVDDPGLFAAAGLDLPDGPGQRTPRGGYHRFFKTDGRRVKQTVKQIPGTDTRVGGKGYVIAWEPHEFPAVADLPDAPEWLYAGAEDPEDDEARPSRGRVEVAQFKMGSRDNDLASFAGTMRRGGAGPDAIYAALKAMVANGQVEQTREDPITDRDLRRISGSIGTRQSDAVDKGKRVTPPFQRAGDLLEKDLRPLEYPVSEIFPEGLGIVAGAPKVGKSWLTLQSAIEIACGGRLLGRATDKARPVLYYGLEDGERRFQKRIRAVDGGRGLDLSLLALKYDAPTIGEGLEDDVADFIDSQGGDAIVIIDILAKIRPPAKGRGTAYDEDYSVIGPLQTLCKERPGAGIVVVTHDRKAGSEDWLTTVTGSRGVVGAADWVWVVKRERLEDVVTIFVTGRDIERDSAITARFDGVWSLAGRLAPSSLSAAAKRVWQAVEDAKPCDTNEVTDAIYGDVTADANRANHFNAVTKILSGLEDKGYVKKANASKPFLYVSVTDEELVAGHHGGLVPVIRRVSRAGARVEGDA